MAFKMKGSPLHRNFGVGSGGKSPLTQQGVTIGPARKQTPEQYKTEENTWLQHSDPKKSRWVTKEEYDKIMGKRRENKVEFDKLSKEDAETFNLVAGATDIVDVQPLRGTGSSPGIDQSITFPATEPYVIYEKGDKEKGLKTIVTPPKGGGAYGKGRKDKVRDEKAIKKEMEYPTGEPSPTWWQRAQQIMGY